MESWAKRLCVRLFVLHSLAEKNKPVPSFLAREPHSGSVSWRAADVNVLFTLEVRLGAILM